MPEQTMASNSLGLNVFVTGGIGFIGTLQRYEGQINMVEQCRHAELPWLLLNAGSHTVLSLLEHGCKVTIIDNLDNAFQVAYERMQKLAGGNSKNMTFVKVWRH